MNKGTEVVTHNGQTIAIIVYDDFKKEGVNFLTPDHFSQQVAFISHETGKKITAHTHKKVKREVEQTHETLFIKRGKLKVNLYDHKNEFIDSRTLQKGDLILLVSGGHGFEVLEDLEMIEVKQGPYAGSDDKVTFES